jgi:hypothetical protein
MKAIEPRHLHVTEVAVVKAALERARFGEPCEASSTPIEALQVVGTCQCGCDSLYFSGINEANEPFRVADGLGYTEDGEEIGVIVWASGVRIVHLELYNYVDLPPRLPRAETVCSFEDSHHIKE